MTRLETATHIFLIGLCCLSGGILIEQRFFSAANDEPAAPQLVGREVKLPGADWHASPYSVLLQISSTCPYCNASMPFYRRLMATRQAAPAKVPVIVACRDAVAVMQKHLADEQVAVDKVLHSRMAAFPTGTPTVYIVDSKGMVQRAFVGKLDAEGENQLLAIVERGKV